MTPKEQKSLFGRMRNAASGVRTLLGEARVKAMDQIVSVLADRDVRTSERGPSDSQAEREASRRRAKSGGPALPDRDPMNSTPPRERSIRVDDEATPPIVKSGIERGEPTVSEAGRTGVAVPVREAVRDRREPMEAIMSSDRVPKQPEDHGERATVRRGAKPAGEPTSRKGPRPDPRVEPPKAEVESRGEPDYGIFAELPPRYASHRIAIIARDPKWAFVYWDVDRERGAALFEAGARVVLRLLDGNDGRILMSPRVHPESGRYYFRLPAADQVYQVALVAVREDGSETTVLASNRVLAPPELPRPSREPRFVSTVAHRRVLDEARAIDAPPRLVCEDSRRLAVYATPSIAGQALTLLPTHEKPRSAPVEEASPTTPEKAVLHDVAENAMRAVLSGSEAAYLRDIGVGPNALSSAELVR
jgi:hypothetical protein